MWIRTFTQEAVNIEQAVTLEIVNSHEAQPPDGFTLIATMAGDPMSAKAYTIWNGAGSGGTQEQAAEALHQILSRAGVPACYTFSEDGTTLDLQD